MKSDSSWQKVSQWYDDSVGKQGHYYHQTLIIPNILKMLDFKEGDSLLDLACGQGVLSRHLPVHVDYTGVDLAGDLIQAAKKYTKNPRHQFLKSDVTKSLSIEKKDFTCATIILALQNIESPLKVFQQAYRHLKPQGKLLIVLNHPCFRIPRQSSWHVDPHTKIQYRRIDSYMSSMTIPIQTHPGKGKESSSTVSFHHPLSAFTTWLKEAGFSIEIIEEWCSNKVSEGKAAKTENRSRKEIPLFMTIVAQKK